MEKFLIFVGFLSCIVSFFKMCFFYSQSSDSKRRYKEEFPDGKTHGGNWKREDWLRKNIDEMSAHGSTAFIWLIISSVFIWWMW